jgi:FKBP-type peptidyl-prolyl cis-trans isomerase SlyD
MNVAKDMVVSFDYTLKNDKGEVLDASKENTPLIYIHGKGHMIPGLEKNLEGKNEGDSFSITIKPEEAYGHYNEKLVFEMEKEKLSQIEDMKEGMHVKMQTEKGLVLFKILSIGDKMIKLDANHPLAGIDLFFDIDIKEIREATKEELEHGHVHDGHTHE